MGSCRWREEGCPCDSERRTGQKHNKLKRKYKEGKKHDKGNSDGPPGQQPDAGAGGAHQDQRLGRQLPALRSHHLPLRQQGQLDWVRLGGVQGNQLPGFCPETVALTQAFAQVSCQKHRTSQRQTVQQLVASLSSAQMDKFPLYLQADAALLPCFAHAKTALQPAPRQSVQTAELLPPLLESAVQIPTYATRNANAQVKKNSANPSFAPTGNLPLCPRANAVPLETSAHCSIARAYLVLQRDAPPEIWLQSRKTLAAQAKPSATTQTAPRCVALLSGAVTAKLLQFPKASAAQARGPALLKHILWNQATAREQTALRLPATWQGVQEAIL